MRHLLDIMSSTVGQSVQRELRAIGIWEEGFAKVRPELISGLRLCESWCKACEELIYLWKDNTQGRSWVGFDYKDEFVLLLGRRLQEILTLRQTREELSRLLSGDFDTENDQKQMQNARSATLVGSLGKYFAGIDPLLCSHYTDSAWHRAVEKYEKSLAPLDFQIAANFRHMISPLHETPLPLLHELRQFKHLLSRCNIRRALVSEREALLHQLVDMIENMGENFHVLIHDATSGLEKYSCLLGKHVSGILRARQISFHIQDLAEGNTELFGDLEHAKVLLSLGSELQSRCRKTEH